MRGKQWLKHLSFLVAWQVLCPLARAIDGSNVPVLYNSNSQDGQQIANYYSGLRQGVQLVPINGIGTSDDISADDYLNIVRPQVLSALATSKTQIDDIVTTKGMPLRVNVGESEPAPAPGSTLRTYVDPSGASHMILNWNPTSRLESELTSIGSTSTWQQMGDQSWQIPGSAVNNPYNHSSATFSHNSAGTFLTSRLDGFTVSDVEASLDRAQHAVVGPQHSPASGPSHFLVDNDPTKNYVPAMA